MGEKHLDFLSLITADILVLFGGGYRSCHITCCFMDTLSCLPKNCVWAAAFLQGAGSTINLTGAVNNCVSLGYRRLPV